MYENGRIYMGLAGDKRVEMVLKMCNRHGLISGASGTGKTVTMKVMAESFSDAGVPVFMCDVKGDVAGICAPGQSTEDMEKRIDRFGLRETFTYREYPTTFWDIYQEGGHPMLAQLSNRVQHALRAYTPAELKAVRTAAQTFRANPEFRTEDAILELGVGEALTSFLDEEGVPTVVERTKIICPQSSMAPPDPMFRSKAMLHDGMEKYDDSVDNESAYEVLTAEAVKAEAAAEEETDRKIREKEEAAAKKRLQKLEDEERRRQQKLEDQALRKKERQQEKAEADARRRADRIEAELLAVGASVLTRGLLGVLQNQSKK